MKILAIRGENLASLDGPFEVDLQAEPLAGAGVFAIVGRTGAGKSTLLDALCLALYDQAPRLAEAGDLRVGRAEEVEAAITAKDVRNLLRRGRAEGRAEVDFLGVDNRGYRATWTVSRARKRPGGRLQKQTLQLVELDTGDPIGSGKKETLAAIEERVGLDFDQFRRSVLLPQGEFAAFLKGSADERAQILERLTATEIYSRISVAAHARSRAAAQAVSELETRLEDGAPLPEAERAALEDEVQAARTALADIRSRLRAAEASEAWHQRDRVLRGEVAEAEATLIAAESAVEQAAPDRARLARLEAAAPLRDIAARATRAAEAHGEQERVLAGRRQAAAEAETGSQALAAGLAEAERTLGDREAAWTALRPKLEAARRLDHTLEDLDRALARESGSLTELRAEAEGLKARLERQAGEAADLEDTRAEATAWLEAHAGVGPLAREWSRWRDLLERLAGAGEAMAGLDAATATRAPRLSDAEAKLARARDALGREASRLEKALAERRAARAQADARPVAPLQGQLDAEATRLGHLATLGKLAERAEELRGSRDAAARREERARSAAASAREEAAGLEAAQATASARLGDARIHAERLLAALSLEDHRAGLVEGEPCPLCGSSEHPYAAVTPPLRSLLDASRAQVADLETEGTELATRRSQALARAEAQEEAAATAARDAEAAAETLGTLEVEWRRAVAEAGAELPGSPGDPGSLPAVAALVTETRTRSQSLRTERDARERLAQAATEAADAAERQAETHAQAARTVQEAEAALAALRAEADRDQEARGRAEQERTACLGALAPVQEALAWRSPLSEDPRAALEGGAALVAEWTRQEDLRAHAATALVGLTAEVKALQGRLQDLDTRRDRQASALAEMETRRNDTAAERATALDGPADQVEAAAERALGEARERHADRIRAAGRAREALAAAEADRRSAEADLADALREAEEADTRLTQALAGTELDRETLAGLLAEPPAAVQALAEQLRKLEVARHTAEVQLQERRRSLATHQSNPPALPDPEAARTAVAEAQAAEESADAERTRLHGALADDDRQRRRHAEVSEALAAARAEARRWGALSDLIGSHDGKAFRTFAQGLTLEVLVHLANDQLSQLSGRYRLMRVPRTDLGLQVVDRDLADEVRAVHTLSGGETFVVSLALALALSALAAADTRIESLFVDEGFGSLDPETLEAVLATLDALHAGGRQVGVISHVPAIAERMAARVEVESLGAGRSRLRVRAA